MTSGSVVARARRAVLQTTFSLLYTKFGFFHEATGRLVYGAAWEGRRKLVMTRATPGTVVDLGCGEGRLLATMHDVGIFAFGVEPSRQMAQRAVRRGVTVVQGSAQAMPVRSGSVQRVVATYPGPWVIDPETWDEIARIAAPDAQIAILLGGDYSRGRWSSVRRPILRIAYGRQDMDASMPDLGHRVIKGDYQSVVDRWGTAILWCGVRLDDSENGAS